MVTDSNLETVFFWSQDALCLGVYGQRTGDWRELVRPVRESKGSLGSCSCSGCWCPQQSDASAVDYIGQCGKGQELIGHWNVFNVKVIMDVT